MVLGGQSAGSISAAYYAYQYVEDPIVTGLIELSGQPGLLPADDGSAWKAAVNASGCAKSEEEAEQVKCMRSLKPRELKRAVNPSNLVPVTAGSTGGMPAVDNAAVFSVEEYAIRGKEGRFAKLVSLHLPSIRA